MRLECLEILFHNAQTVAAPSARRPVCSPVTIPANANVARTIGRFLKDANIDPETVLVRKIAAKQVDSVLATGTDRDSKSKIWTQHREAEVMAQLGLSDAARVTYALPLKYFGATQASLGSAWSVYTQPALHHIFNTNGFHVFLIKNPLDGLLGVFRCAAEPPGRGPETLPETTGAGDFGGVFRTYADVAPRSGGPPPTPLQKV